MTPGKNLGPYEIVAAIGAGGMGEVYKARDTRLNRTVAIKVLPKEVATDPERRQRFEREAQAIAALNHPNICVVYDVGEEAGISYMVMEYLEGETLEARLEKGPMPLDQALKCAIEIGDAIDKAHQRHVVHRDLKPANIILTKSGAKLLDFGLAKFDAPTLASGVSQLPTNLTMQGTVLGTPQYMSPEQVEGMEPDGRTDIFALGVVLYEMLTGAKAFYGKSHASLMASILEHQPQAMTALQQSIPPSLERIVLTCMQKAPEDRWQNARDLVLQLKWIAEGRSESSSPATAAPVASKGRERVAWALFAVLALALAVVGWRAFNVAPVETPAVEFSIAPPEDAPFAPSAAPIAPLPQVSPNGRYVAFIAAKTGGPSRVWVRSLDSSLARELAGTDGAILPFWSDDSREIGFFVGEEIKRIDRSGGSPLTVFKGAQTAGASWNRDGIILFLQSRNNAISRISVSGGEPVQVTKAQDAKKQEISLFPNFLPDGKRFLYRHLPSGNIYLASLDGGSPIELLKADSEAKYAAPGYLLFVRQGTLLAQAFDAGSATLSGEPFRVADNVRTNGSGFGTFSASDNGVLVYRAGIQNSLRAAFVDRTGRQLDPINQTGDNRWPRLSPDDSRIVVQRQDRDNSDIWIIDAMRGTNSRLTYKPSIEAFPIWSPDGSRIAYGSNPSGKSDLYWKLASGLGEEELLFKSDLDKTPLDFSPDGKFLLFRMDDLKTQIDMWLLSMSDKQAKPFLQTPFNENGGRFSPDGKWVAYFSVESGSSQIYVQPFPPTGAKWQVSVDGGQSVTWGRSKKELYFVAPDNRMMSVEYTAAGEFKAGIPKALFQIPALPPNTGGLRFSITHDDERFLLPVSNATTEHPLTVLLNWISAVTKK